MGTRQLALGNRHQAIEKILDYIYFPRPLSDYVAMWKSLIPVIPSVARDLVFSATYEDEIPRLCLGMTVTTQSLCGKVGEGEGKNNRG